MATLRILHVVNVTNPLFFKSVAVAPFAQSLSSLTIDFSDGSDLPRDLPPISLQALEDLEIVARPRIAVELLAALDRGSSHTNVKTLKVLRSIKSRSQLSDRDKCLKIKRGAFRHSFRNLITLSIIGFLIHPCTILALSGGLFGQKLETLFLGSCEPDSWNPNPFVDESLPPPLRFSMPALKCLGLIGPFHSTMMDAFGYAADLPSLSTVTCAFSGIDLGPIRLDDYVFQSRFVSAIARWDVLQKPEHTRIPWRSFYRLSCREEFKPTRLGDHSDPNLTPSIPWATVCGMKSLLYLYDLRVSTKDILMYGVPTQTSFMSLVLFMSGLKQSDVDEVAKVLLPIDKGECRVKQTADPKFVEEYGCWVDLIRAGTFGNRLTVW